MRRSAPKIDRCRIYEAAKFDPGNYRRPDRLNRDNIFNYLGTAIAACATFTVVVAWLSAFYGGTLSVTHEPPASTPIVLAGYYPSLISTTDFARWAPISPQQTDENGFESKWGGVPATSATFIGVGLPLAQHFQKHDISLTSQSSNISTFRPAPVKPEIDNAANPIRSADFVPPEESNINSRSHMVGANLTDSEPMLRKAITNSVVAPKLPTLSPSSLERRVTPQQGQSRRSPLLDLAERTAVYDIAAHTVYLPNGEKLEAHSGFGDKLDDPRYVSLKDRGPTPPNKYALTMREQLFHDLPVIRLVPVGGRNMFGRNGILVHPYMLSANGQSNGCVSIKDFQAFLAAYLRGEIDHLLVVPHLGNIAWSTAGGRRELSRKVADITP